MTKETKIKPNIFSAFLLYTVLIDYIYNSADEVVAARYKGKTYYYLKSATGDVVGATDETGRMIGLYQYDAWGNETERFFNTTDADEEHFLSVNPMKYRGYYLDYEMEMYYLQSRYYFSHWCRFFNSDLPEYAQIQKDEQIGTNLFAYCCNNPVNYADYNGNWGEEVHYGYNENSTDHKYYTKVNGEREAYGTYAWALSLKITESNSKKLAKYCNDLDKDMPSYLFAIAWATGSASPEELAKYKSWQYYHFNGKKSGKDSRTKFSEEKMKNAVNIWKNAKKAYDKEIKKIKKECKHGYSNKIEKCKKCKSKVTKAKNKWNTQKNKALKQLGYGLHALQDIDAHGQIGRGAFIPQHVVGGSEITEADNIDYIWKNGSCNSVQLHRSRKRLARTRDRTKEYLKEFLNSVKGYGKV